jgi:SNW domain-containing protein 1
MGKIQKANRFEVLGRAREGFRGADVADEREGPVQFEKDKDDPFGIDNLIGEVTGRAPEASKKQKRYGLEEAGSSDRSRKRAKVDDDDDDDAEESTRPRRSLSR